MYTGKSARSYFGFCTDIVLTLCETVPRMINHKIYTDNYFTTIRLQVELKKLGIFSVGTVRSNRLPGITMKGTKQLSREGRGSTDHRLTQVDGVELCATRWYDNNAVDCLSTLHACESMDKVERWSAKEKKRILVKRPNVIKLYNQYMGGVDLNDMLVSLYRINIRSKKYYMKLIFHLIDECIVNGWLLYRRHCSQLRVPKTEIRSLLEFRVDVADALLKSTVATPTKRRGRPVTQQLLKRDRAGPTRVLPARMPLAAVRLDDSNHWPIVTSKGRCRNPGCDSHTTIFCSKCQIRLCLSAKQNCFVAFHQ